MILTTFLLTIASTAQAPFVVQGPAEENWKALETEPSPGDLFKSAVQPHTSPTGSQVFVFPHSFQFPTDADHDVDGKVRINTRFGIDISHHNGANFPVQLLHRQSVSFVYIKATQGTDFADKTFGERWAAIKALPAGQSIPRGAYHFLSSNKSMSGAAQADRFLAYVALHGGFENGDLRPALDLEWDRACLTCVDRWSDRPPQERVTTALDFVHRVKEKTGWTPLIYTNRSFLSGISRMQIGQMTQAAKIWIFDLAKDDRHLEIADPAHNLPYVLWQFSWGSSLSNGYSGDLDVDSFKGTEAEFHAMFLTKN